MAKLITIDKLVKGMNSDDRSPGTLREVVDMLPWRGSLRKRGGIDTLATVVSSASEISSGFNSLTTAYGLRVSSHHTLCITNSTGDWYGYNGTSWTDLLRTGNRGGRAFEADGELVVLANDAAGNATTVYRYAGGVAQVGALSGTASTTAGSKRVTFSVAQNTSTMATNGFIFISPHAYGIESVVSTTEVILTEPARVTTTAAVSLYTAADYNCSNAESTKSMFSQANGGGYGPASLSNVVKARAGCWHQGRVFFGNIYEAVWNGTNGSDRKFGNRIRWSALKSETDTNNFQGKQYFDSDAYIDLGDDGGDIFGMHSYEGALIVLRRRCVQVLTGAFATNGTDLGVSVQTVARNVGVGNVQLWSDFEGGVAFADENGCYLWDGKQVRNLTRGRIEIAWKKEFTPDEITTLTLCTPGNRICVFGEQGASGSPWFVYDIGYDAWFRMRTEFQYSRIVETKDGEYVSVRRTPYGGGSNLRSYDFYNVFENLGSSSMVNQLDLESSSTYFPRPYVVTNAIPLGNGFDNGRVTHVALADAGHFSSEANVTYTAELQRGPIYSVDLFSSETNTGSQLASETVPPPSTSARVQRGVLVRMDGSAEATHAGVVISAAPSPAGGSPTFGYALEAIGLYVEENPSFESA